MHQLRVAGNNRGCGVWEIITLTEQGVFEAAGALWTRNPDVTLPLGRLL
ncbi:MAG TPA: hypothetical protein VFL57_17645 [Bryobacteraceae bacterium]|nr:hypothetical protein [Bryobacteraceae bacterium]